VVVVFNMRREAPRTLLTLSPIYQQNVSAMDYEVIVVENGSSTPLTAQEVAQFGPNFRYLWIDNASPSPAGAINRGVALSKAPFVGIMIDGARMATPGVVALALECLGGFARAVVGTVGFHLGPDVQMQSICNGYNTVVEDELLDGIDWRNNGYRLFEISALAGSSPTGWLGTINESNLLFLSRTLFDELGGFDERFSSPGGGIVNLDFYRRACDLPNSTLITLLGEATFHQVHGGAMANQPASELPQRLQACDEEHRRIRGAYFERSSRTPLLFGPIRPEIIPWLHKTLDQSEAQSDH
jgi:glycosyltransferase involved in cell wall biosynthesis